MVNGLIQHGRLGIVFKHFNSKVKGPKHLSLGPF